MVKKEIRKEYNRKRQELSDEMIGRLSSDMLENFRSLDLEGVRVLLSYHPITGRKEFDVALCEQAQLATSPSTQIAWPRLDDDLVTMQAVTADRHAALQKNRFNILEPVGPAIVDPQLIDAVFVPLLAFDIHGYRVGYGKGFYDRFLARCSPGIVKVGFSFFEALPFIEDVNEYDVPLNYCITPLRVYEF